MKVLYTVRQEWMLDYIKKHCYLLPYRMSGSNSWVDSG
jgi:hypothetical protein